VLSSLLIKNIVLIDQLTVAFRPGFCALTGETGAGKSILLDSLGLALGARSDAGLIRKGAEQAQVTAEFEIDAKHPVYSLLAGQGIEIESGEPLLLRRMILPDGRSKASINDQPVSVGLLRAAGDLLVEIHGQFDTQGLLDPKTHRGLLDEYAGIDTAALAGAWQGWQEAARLLAEARDAIARAQSDEEYLRAAIEDLDELAPQAGEEEKLAALRDRLMRREQILQALNTAHAALEESQRTANSGWRALERAGGEGVAEILDGIDRAVAELQEAAARIESLSADLSEEGRGLEEIDDRLHALRAQARKHHCAADDLPALRDALAARLNAIEGGAESVAELERKVAAARKAYMTAAEAAHQARFAAAQKLDKLVAKELPPLKLEKARFETAVQALPENEWGPQGSDLVRFRVATNPGAAAGDLHKIASGGEMSRFMLALKVVLAEVGAAQCLVFDEADSGIGGPTAAAVGERFARLAKKRQVLTVTHSPQVAARAQHHLIVMKEAKKGETRTTVAALEEMDMRREEVARMLSGASVTKEARAAAEKLLEKTGS
jgi:DNA repair protein RecN (Recombination protein N)